MDPEAGATHPEVHEYLSAAMRGGRGLVSDADVGGALRRLAKMGRVSRPMVDGQRRHTLTDSAAEDVSQGQDASEQRLSRVVAGLFANADEGHQRYHAPFLTVVSDVAAQLAEADVLMLIGEQDGNSMPEQTTLEDALRKALEQYSDLDEHALRTGVIAFFRDVEPDYDEIKMQLAQNYYVLKALGLDSSGELLSRQAFGGAVFYLDTNVLIDGLAPCGLHHRGFQALASACAKLGCELRVAGITLEQLEAVVSGKRAEIPRIADQVPEGTADKVHDVFYQLYRNSVDDHGERHADQAFSMFDNAAVALSEEYGVTTEEDAWFRDAEQERAMGPAVSRVVGASARRYMGKKSRPSALHDAKMLGWVEKRRLGENNSSIWFVTLDGFLDGMMPSAPELPPRPLAIHLVPLLQWISPVAGVHDTPEMATSFAEVMRERILPQERFFGANDFRVLADLGYQCRDLPPEDVEECVRYIRTGAASLDLTKAEDRETVSYRLAQFFSDPSRTYAETLRDKDRALQKELVNSRNARDAMESMATRLAAEEDARRTAEATAEQAQADAEAAAEAARQSDVAVTEAARRDRENAERSAQKALRESAVRRLITLVMSFCFVEAWLVYWIYTGQATGTAFERLNAGLAWYGLPFVALIICSWFVLGPQRIRALGPGWQKVLQDDSGAVEDADNGGAGAT
jgi:hypothetical protein